MRAGVGTPRDETIGRRLLAFLAAIVCLLFVVGLRDTALLGRALSPPAPPPPTRGAPRDANLDVLVRDEVGHPLGETSIRVFAMHEGRAYFAGDRNADSTGRARFRGLPRGEVWVLGYGPEKARASTRAVLASGDRVLELVLGPARALDTIVVDELDHPVKGAMVEVRGNDPLPYSAITASDGSARVDRLGTPPYSIRVSAQGYEEVRRAGVVPTSGPVRIRLERTGWLVVSVVEPDGGPAAAATVLAAGSGLWPARSIITDDQGTARIGGLPGGVYELKARLGSKVSHTEVGVAVKRGETKEVTLTLGLGKWVRATITDGAGEGAPPIRDASVVLVEEGISSFPVAEKTNEAGVVNLGPVEQARAILSAHAPGFVTGTVTIDAQTTEVRVPLLRGGTLVGDVVDDGGYPIAGATIEVVGVDSEGMPIDETNSMSDFRDERFEVSLRGPAPLIPMGELGVTIGAIPDFSHLPAAPDLPTARPAGAANHGDPWVTRADGTFRINPVPPGRVHAIVRHPSWVEAISDPVTIQPGGEARVHVVLHQGGFIEGRVLEEDRVPVRGARVELAATHGSLERTTTAADDGTFTFPAVPDEVLLSVYRPDAPSEVAAQVVVSVPERERRSVEIILPKARDKVSIRVTDNRGYPVDRVEIRATSVDLKDALRRTLFTSESGECELPGGAGLSLRFTLQRPGKAPLVRYIENTPRELRFEMAEGVEGRGRVTTRDGRDRVPGAEVTLFTSTGTKHAQSDADGVFAFRDLAPGRVRISVNHAPYAPQVQTVVVQGDRDRPADLGVIDLLPAGEVEGDVVDPDDSPVAGARVGRDGVPTYLPLGPLPAGIVATDRQGRFKLSGMPEGRINLEAYFGDFGRGRAEGIEIRAGQVTERVRIKLPGDATVAKDANGAGSVAVTLGERGEGRARTVMVVMVPVTSEADVAGVEPEDDLLAVNGHAVGSIEEARRLLTGPLSEDVLLDLRRDNEGTFRVRVRRERVRR